LQLIQLGLKDMLMIAEELSGIKLQLIQLGLKE